MRLNVVIGVYGPLQANAGGPRRVAYDLLRTLFGSVKENFQVYVLDFREGCIHSLEDLDSIVSNNRSVENPENLTWFITKQFKQHTKFFIARIPASDATRGFLADSILSLKAHSWKRRVERVMQGMPRHAVLHVHGGAEMGDALAFFLERLGESYRVVWTEHSKGSALRELEQLFGSRYVDVWGRGIWRAYEALLQRADRIVFPSKGAVRLFEEYTGWEIPLERLRIVYNGVEDPFSVLEGLTEDLHEKGLLITVAQHVPEKGLDWIIEGLAMVKKPWRWVIIGEFTSWTDSLRSLVRKYGLESRVDFVGSLPKREVLSWMLRSEAVIHAPRVAVFDLALLEAMALAKPILATPVGGNVEALGEGYPMFVRTPEELAKYIDESDCQFYKWVGQNNRKRFLEKFTLTAMVQSYVSLYKELW